MKEITIEELGYLIKQAKNKPIFFLGAGASVSGDIPLAGDIVKDILSKYNKSPFINKLEDKEKTYSKLMECLLPNQRNELLKGYIDKGKINVTHIYLAQLLKEGFADYILTVNFDNLMLRALALYNEFPPTYDMAILNDLTTTTFKEKSVVYLHGQHHGLWLLNTEDEMAKVKSTLPRVFDSIKNERPWIFIGYSGADPVFEHIKNLGRFDNGLYWVGYHESKPAEHVQQFLSTTNTNAFYVKGYDADAFMLKLNETLELEQPKILDKPFTALGSMLGEINDINDEEHFKGVKERLEIAKKNVQTSIKQFELNEKVDIDKRELEINKLKKEIIDIMISEVYDPEAIKLIEDKVKVIDNDDLNGLLSDLYNNWGVDIAHLAKIKDGEESEELYKEAIQKYLRSSEINSDDSDVFNNWGIALYDLAKIKKGEESEDLYKEAFNKYLRASEINSDDYRIFDNWGNTLLGLARIKEGEESEELYKEAIQKYLRSSEINAENHLVFNNWGNALVDLAKIKDGEESEELYKEAIQKYLRSSEINADDSDVFNNWGNALVYLARIKEGEESESLYKEAFNKYLRASEINAENHLVFNNWGNALVDLAKIKDGEESEELYKEAIQKYLRSSEINADDSDVFNNWGNALVYLARIKEGEESESLYKEAFNKYLRSSEIKPDNSDVFNNWGNTLLDLARIKEGEESESLYKEAFNKYLRASEINSDDYRIFDNWGNTLLGLAKAKEGEESEELYKEAFEKLNRAVELGASSYNLSCAYALIGEKENALKYLKVTLENKEITVDFVLKDEDWKAYLNDKDFIALIGKYTVLSV